MPIPESQLETWAHQGSVIQSATTYGAVRSALEAAHNNIGKPFEVFLQGSYGNDTNIYSESDVDVVTHYTGAFFHDLSLLPTDQQSAFRDVFLNGAYTFAKFRSDVEAALCEAFGVSVRPDTKAIKVCANGARRNADVIPAFSFRRYFTFRGLQDQEFVEGISFYTTSGELIANYPKIHARNLTAKHKSTEGMFKPLVRILKNLRSRLMSDGTLPTGEAPSYFLEGLLYNVPSELMVGTFQQAMVNSLNWILSADRSQFVCANEQYYLLRASSVTWAVERCERFLAAALRLWNNW